LAIDNNEQQLVTGFLHQAAEHLEQDFLPKIRRCLPVLSEEDVWWRGSESENSIGNLMLHLSGNVRQWIIAGLGGAADHRERSKEFSARDSVTKEAAFSLLESTVLEACAVLVCLSAEDLLRTRTIQGFQRTGLQVILHVVEHFSYHTGQIVYVTKLRTHKDMKFYDL
jgi:uncharacterized damage-inducible protein DinB